MERRGRTAVRPYNRLQDRANSERETWNVGRETRWSKTSGWSVVRLLQFHCQVQ